MNIKSIGSPESPEWMKRFKPTDLKWLNAEKTAALCVLNDNRYRLKVIFTNDRSTRGTNAIEIASTQETELEALEHAFNSFEPSAETEAMAPEAVVNEIRSKIAS